MNADATREKGHEAYRRRDWTEAYALLSKLDEASGADGELPDVPARTESAPLSPIDLEVLARAAYLTGHRARCIQTWTRAHQGFLDAQDTQHAAGCAFWLGLILILQGDRAQGGGWIARAARLLDEIEDECVEHGFLLVSRALQQLGQDPQQAYELFGRAGALGRRFENPDLTTLARLGQGQALVNKNDIPGGMSLLDESMVAVVSSQTTPIVTGIVYCAVIETCCKIYDVRRAQEWTTALGRWCEAQPDLAPYRGQCVVRRAQILQLHGEWPDAMTEARKACDLLSDPGEPAAGEAFYRRAELLRLRGEYSEAEATYAAANRWGRSPQPGLALLRLGQGKTDAAAAAIRRCREEMTDRLGRAAILPAYIEIMLAAGEQTDARAAAHELSEIAEAFRAPYLTALAAQAAGHVLLEAGEAQAALEKLIRAWSLLKGVEALYESAQTRVLIGQTYRALGDEDSAEMELEAARWMFHELGAAPEIAHVVSLIGGHRTSVDGIRGGDSQSDGSQSGGAQDVGRTDKTGDTYGLTPRELEVLALVTTGKTNRDIADDLHISERTVDRHVSNILAKLDVPSRAAATAFAYENNLIQ